MILHAQWAWYSIYCGGLVAFGRLPQLCYAQTFYFLKKKICWHFRFLWSFWNFWFLSFFQKFCGFENFVFFWKIFFEIFWFFFLKVFKISKITNFSKIWYLDKQTNGSHVKKRDGGGGGAEQNILCCDSMLSHSPTLYWSFF